MKINKCINCNTEFTKPHNPNREYLYCSKKCYWNTVKKRQIKECPQCNNTFDVIKYYQGQVCCSTDCANKYKDKWKTTEAFRIRTSKEYAIWRKSVFERDNFTCVWCWKLWWKLNADHIKPFALFPELRLAIDNWRTLCEKCHRTTDTFGNRKNKYNTI